MEGDPGSSRTPDQKQNQNTNVVGSPAMDFIQGCS